MGHIPGVHIGQQRVDGLDDRLVDDLRPVGPRSANSSIWAVIVATNTPAVNGSTGSSRSARRACTRSPTAHIGEPPILLIGQAPSRRSVRSTLRSSVPSATSS
ncbi:MULTISPECIES: hypothetical protein [unclassified Streptomyces]|uniref:hypothetical protein n=1 Tax=unclassified Streptomyces TaxID=2593676 RepID=UPI002366CD45|nr:MULTISPECIES: hypothetical protein [unclassified Streptomyces]MDF3147685.1 hypothetical protein [Streptomyces sp. T21Q-yed]WDF44984.1 hypothetical protein PBV52_03310 [Streptomyces sp. T12]